MQRSRLENFCWSQVAIGAVLLTISVANSFSRPALQMSWSSNSGLITEVREGGAARNAGLRVGDRIESFDGDRVGGSLVPLHRAAAGRPVEVRYLRDGVSHQTRLLPPTLWDARMQSLALGGSDAFWALSGFLSIPVNLWMFAIGIAVLALRGQSKDANLSALTFLYWACGNFLVNATGLGSLIESWPVALRLILYLADGFFVAGFFATCLHFAFIFPSTDTVTQGRRWLPFLPYIAAATIFLESSLVALARVGSVAPPPSADMFYSFVGPAMLLLACGLLVRNARRAEEANTKRRLKLIVLALFPGVLSFLVLLVLDQLDAPASVRQFAWLVNWLSVIAASWIYAYAVIRHRLFDIRLLVRRSLQYALARTTVLALMTLPAIALAAFLFSHRNESLSTLFTGKPGVYLLVLVPLVAVLQSRRRILDSLDRRFFREQYDSRQMLLHVVSMIRSGADSLALSRLALVEIEKALHPKHISIWQIDPVEGEFRRSFHRSETSNPPALPAVAAIATLLATQDEPLDLDSRHSESLVQRLPVGEREWLERTDARLLVPLLIETRLAGFLLLGERMSEEPFSREDRELLRTLAGQLSLTFDYARLKTSPSLIWTPQPLPVLSSADELRICPSCRRAFASDLLACPQDQTALVREEGVPRLIEDKYEIKRLLGRGGMGSVYLATQRRLQRPVAVKVLLTHLVASPTMRARFEREARIVAHLRHPGIVTIHDFGVLPSGHAYLVMELVEGQTLRQFAGSRPLSIEQALGILRPVGEAVDAAHQMGVIHRDLKPDNIMLASSPSENQWAPKVLDFGLAKLHTPIGEQDTTLAQSSQSGGLIGTLPYMAPELLSGHDADARSDQYSLGIVAYEILAGSHPFEGTDIASIVLAHTVHPVPPLLDRAPHLSSVAASAVHRALDRDPAKRFASIGEFVNALAG